MVGVNGAEPLVDPEQLDRRHDGCLRRVPPSLRGGHRVYFAGQSPSVT